MFRLFNSLSRKIEDFVPIRPPEVGMYTCGPTVYDYTHIGHGRKYVMDDTLRRTLGLFGYKVKQVMNITDVGHMVSDADEGDDKLEKGAKKFGKTVWEVAEFFTDEFNKSMRLLNVLGPDVLCKATEHIPEQIDMIEKLIKKGFAYDTPEAVYFEVDKFGDYDKLFGQRRDERWVAVREEVMTGEWKKSPADFVLWFKRVGKFVDHTMHWDSQWGDGFPGWHIECSAMSMKYLGEQIDIHTGGEDHKTIHHPNEIAQSEASSGKRPFVKYWVHHSFLTVDGRKMSKSLGNFYRVDEIVDRGVEALALRYFYLLAHYRKQQNFTWVGLEAAAAALTKLRRLMKGYGESRERTTLSEDKLAKIDKYRQEFRDALADDMNTPQALGVVWAVVKSNIPDYDKFELIREFDQVLGLNLVSGIERSREIPGVVLDLVASREEERKLRNWDEADRIRGKIEAMGYKVEDVGNETRIEKKS